MAVKDTASVRASDVHSGGLLDWILGAFRRLFASPPSTNPAPRTTVADVAPAEESGASDIIVAPGGFPIQCSHTQYLTNSVDNVLPDVRQGLNQLPPLPTVVIELLKEIQRSSSSAASVGEIVASDPSLAASILRMVNAAALGLPRKITSVAQAVSYLGFDTVRALVVQLRLEQMLPHRTPEAAAEADGLWAHSMAVSYIGTVLAERVLDLDRGFISTLGLLHDIGRLAILSKFPDRRGALAAAGAENESRMDREAKAFGADHAAIGALLSNRWKLPADLTMAIRWHHNPEKAFEPTDPEALRKSVYLIHLADQIAKYCFSYAHDMEIERPAEGTFERLGLSATSVPELIDAKVRAAATQAILFADENSKRPLTTVRPFLELHRGEEAARLASRLTTAEAPSRIKVGDSGKELIQNASEKFEFDPKSRSTPKVAEAPWAYFTADSSPQAVEWLAKTVPAQWENLTIPSKARSCARVALRSLLPNLIAADQARSSDTIHVAYLWDSDRLEIAVESPAMAFAGRMPASADQAASLRVLEAELANILNLGWFDFETSADGTMLVMRSRSN